MTNLNVAEQIRLEQDYSRSGTGRLVRTEIEERFGNKIAEGAAMIEAWFDKVEWPSKDKRKAELRDLITAEELVSAVLVQLLPCTVEMQYTQAVGLVAPILELANPIDAARTAGEVIGVIWDLELYDLISSKKSESGHIMLVSTVELSESLLIDLAKRKHLPPMLCKPAKITSNRESGYLTFNSSLMLNDDGSDDDKCISYFNTQNSVALEIDVELAMSLAVDTVAMPEPKSSAEKHKLAAQAQFKALTEQVSATTELLVEYAGRKFWIPNGPDGRGRTYDKGYLIKSQGKERQKAALSLSKKVFIDIT